jgi:hypothetical protein
MKRLLLAATALCAAVPAAAQHPAAASAPVHVVRPGDTLWDLARQYLQDPFQWTEIYRVNRGVVSDPHRIFPAERLRIPGGTPAGSVEAAPAEQFAGRTVFTPEEPVREGRVFATPAPEARSVVAPGDFHRAGLLVRETELTPLGVLADVLSPSVVPTEIPRAIQPYDRVFVRVVPGRVAVGDRLHFVRAGQRVGAYGRIFESTGLARVEELNGEVATAVVGEMYADVSVGDLAIPVAEFNPAPGATPTAASGLEGRLLAFQNPHALHALQDLAFVDLGEASGVKVGDEFAVVLPPEREPWGVRPEIVVARVQVVRVTRLTSAVRVTELEHPALEPGLPVRLVGKMP